MTELIWSAQARQECEYIMIAVVGHILPAGPHECLTQWRGFRRDCGLSIIGETWPDAHEIEQPPAMAPPYASLATSVFARSEARNSEGERCHLHPRPGQRAKVGSPRKPRPPKKGRRDLIGRQK